MVLGLEVVTAIGGCIQIIRGLYDFYATNKRNRSLLDILDGFTSNLSMSIERLQAREDLLMGHPSEALLSIQRDFTNAQNYLLSNSKNLKSVWSTLQASQALRSLDERLTKAFAGKMSIALFEAIQETHEAVARVEGKVDGIQEAITEGVKAGMEALKEEAYLFGGGGGGGGDGSNGEKKFKNGEAEKIISQLVDRLAQAERDREEAIELGMQPSSDSHSPFLAAYPPLLPEIQRSDSMRVPGLSRELTQGSYQSTSGDSYQPLLSTRPSISSGSAFSHAWQLEGLTREESLRKGKESATVPVGSIVFAPVDPFTKAELIDPVLANDGLIHCRWTLTEEKHSNPRDKTQPLVITGDLVQLREAIFSSFPERRLEFKTRRTRYREETLDLYDNGGFPALAEVINRLSHVLLWDANSIDLRVLRATARYRMGDFTAALRDLDDAVDLSKRSRAEGDKIGVDLEAVRRRALLRNEIHDYAGSLADIASVLPFSPNDILLLSLRAVHRGRAGDLVAAQADLASTNMSIRGGLAPRSALGDADADLEYRVRGWAYAGIRDFKSAAADFTYSLSLREPEEPYTLACLGLAKVHQALASGTDPNAEVVREGSAMLDQAIAAISFNAVQWRTAAEGCLGKWSSGVSIGDGGRDGLGWGCGWGLLLLRGGSLAALGKHSAALLDLKRAKELRPSVVRDTAELRLAMAEAKAEMGDKEGALQDCEMAVALDPVRRFEVSALKDQYRL